VFEGIAEKPPNPTPAGMSLSIGALAWRTRLGSVLNVILVAFAFLAEFLANFAVNDRDLRQKAQNLNRKVRQGLRQGR
jgi:hypothetical protein